MIVDLAKHKIKDPIEQDFESMPYMPVMLSIPEKPDPIQTHHCDKCDRVFDYLRSLENHIEADHLTPNTKMTPYPTNFLYFGRPKNRKQPKIIRGQVEEVIVENDKLKTVFLNANSIVSYGKRSTTKLGIQEANAHIVVIAETKMGKNHTEFKVPGYYTAANLIREANSGGLAVMAKTNIQLHEITTTNILPEIQFVSFRFKDIAFFAVYRSPSYGKTPPKDHHKCLIDHLDKEIDKLKGSRYVLLGDFNISTLAKNNFEPRGASPDVDTDSVAGVGNPAGKTTTTYAGLGGSKHKNKNKNNINAIHEIVMSIEQLWADFKNRRSLDQWVNENTFHRFNSIAQVLVETMTDLVFTPYNVPIHQIKVDKELFQGRYDHYAVVFTIDLKFQTNETPRVRRLHEKKNWSNFIKLLLSYKLFDTAPRTTTDAMANYISDKIMEAYNEACPLVEVKPPPPGGHFHKETKRFIKKATRLRAKRRLVPPGTKAHQNVWIKLKLIEKCVDAMIKNDHVQNQIKLLERSKHDHTNFYAHIKKARSKTSTIGPVYDMSGTLRSSDEELTGSFSDLLGDQLRPVYSPYDKPINWFKPHKEGLAVEKSINSLHVTPDMVKYHITRSKRSAAAGPDMIPMEAIAIAGEILVEPLAALYNKINETGDVPKCFRTARVKMLYKKGAKSDMLHYRPLSMSNHIGKLWERLVKDKLVGHLEKNNLLSKHQHGFRPFRGTTTNLLHLWELIMNRVETEKSNIELWNYDLSKAFDMLDHAKVLDLLHRSGVWGILGKTIQSWLTTRTQTVEVGLSKSEERAVGRSCCQGSVLGPILWLVYIQSLMIILDELDVDYVAYADDLSIVQRITTKDDKTKFEKVLRELQKWAGDFNMKWSPLKTQRMVFRYQNCPEPQTPFEITFGGKDIQPLESTCVSLGVLFDRNCTFKSQIRKVCNQIRAMTSLIKQEIANITPTILKKFYQVYVLPALTYCCQVWNPADEIQLREVEKAVNDFWKLSKKGPPKDHIPPRLLLIILDLNYVKKLKEGNHVLDFDAVFETEKYKIERKDLNDKLPIIRKDLQVSRTKFSYRTRPYWNKLPKQIREMTYSGFKTKAKEFVMDNAREFLNMGNKDKEVIHKIFEPNKRPVDTTTETEGKVTITEEIEELNNKWHKNFRPKTQNVAPLGLKEPNTKQTSEDK